MKLFLDNKEVTIEELKLALDNLDYGPPDGGNFEEITLEKVDVNGNLFFETAWYSAF